MSEEGKSKDEEVDVSETTESLGAYFDDGMDPPYVPQRITKENFRTEFPIIPEGLSSDIFEDGTTLELSQ